MKEINSDVMKDYYKVVSESNERDVKADMELILNICAHNEINTEEDVRKVYNVLSSSDTFKSGIGRLFVSELHDRILDYRYITDVQKNNKNLNDITVVKSIIEDMKRNGVPRSRAGHSFLQQLLSLEKELETIDIIRDNYNLNNDDVVWNLLLVLTEPGREYFHTEEGKKFVASLEKKVGKVYTGNVNKRRRLVPAIAIMFFLAGISIGVGSKFIYDDLYNNKVTDSITGQTSDRLGRYKEKAPNELFESQYDILQGVEGSKRATLILDGNAGVLEKYEKLASENPDMCGWIKVSGTDIDYPVMHRADNSYYLEHNFYGDYDRNGSLFIDRYCSIFPQSENIIIYGHNVNGAPSFGQIKNYKDELFCKYNPTIQFDTIYEEGTYEVVASFITSVDKKEEGFKYYLFYGYDNEEQFNEFAEYVRANAAYDTGVDMKYGDHFITLSTCDYAVSDGRFVVVAKKIEE